jgi:hypothetical protein
MLSGLLKLYHARTGRSVRRKRATIAGGACRGSSASKTPKMSGSFLRHCFSNSVGVLAGLLFQREVNPILGAHCQPRA